MSLPLLPSTFVPKYAERVLEAVNSRPLCEGEYLSNAETQSQSQDTVFNSNRAITLNEIRQAWCAAVKGREGRTDQELEPTDFEEEEMGKSIITAWNLLLSQPGAVIHINDKMPDNITENNAKNLLNTLYQQIKTFLPHTAPCETLVAHALVKFVKANEGRILPSFTECFKREFSALDRDFSVVAPAFEADFRLEASDLAHKYLGRESCEDFKRESAELARQYSVLDQVVKQSEPPHVNIHMDKDSLLTARKPRPMDVVIA